MESRPFLQGSLREEDRLFEPDLRLEIATRLFLPPGLAIAPGGNGMARGGGGDGSARPVPPAPARPRPQVAAVDTDEIELLKEVLPVIRNAPRGVPSWVMMRVRMDAEGVPLSVTPLSGPPELWPPIVAALMQWRFRVPARLKPQAPLRMDVRVQLQFV